jgi:hypothetical protein
MFVIGAIYGVHYGTGRHHKDLTEGDIRNAMRVGHHSSPLLDHTNIDFFLSFGGCATLLIV